MKRVRLMAAACMVAMVGFTACGDADKKEENAETAEMHEGEAHDDHAGHDHAAHAGHEDHGAADMGEGEGEDMAPIEAMTFEQPSSEIKAHLSEVVKHYLDLKTSLVQDNAEGASHASGPLVRMNIDPAKLGNPPAEQVDYLTKGLRRVSDHAVAINVTRDIDMQRKAFEDLSSTLYALVKTFGSETKLYKQYCPMAFDNKGAYWISNEEEVLNPYFGDAMLKCGRVDETIEM